MGKGRKNLVLSFQYPLNPLGSKVKSRLTLPTRKLIFPMPEAAAYKVLIVDDSVAHLRTYALILKKQGFEATTLEDPSKVMEAVQQQRPDAVLLDWKLGEADGFEVLGELKSDPNTLLIPVVLFSGTRTKNDLIMALELGASDFLVKGKTSSSELAKALTTAIEEVREELAKE